MLFLIIGICTNNMNSMMDGIMGVPKVVYDLVLTLILSACLWGGFLNIIEKSGFMNMFSYILKPFLKLIYGSIINNKSINSSF